MIRARYERGAHRLTVSGHAGFAAPGEDLVCAGVTVLIRTLSEAVSRLGEAGLLSDSRVHIAYGEAEIVCVPEEEFRCLVHSVMDSICLGLALLEREFRDYVQFEQV